MKEGAGTESSWYLRLSYIIFKGMLMSRLTCRVCLVALCGALLPADVLALPVTENAGGGQSHTNRQPSLGVHHIIATEGLFPSRNLTAGVTTTGGSEPFLGEVSMFGGNFAPRGWMFAEGQELDIAQHTALFSLLGTTYGGDGRTTFRLPDLRGRTGMHWGQGPGLSNRTIGQTVGSAAHTLTQAEMPGHAHTLPGPANTLTGPAGGGQPHNNMAPTLGLTYATALNGIFPSRNLQVDGAGSGAIEPFIGEVSAFAFNFAPRNWALANGQLLPISQYSALFSILGTTYGGDGRTTFALPDLRGRAAMGPRTGPGLSPRSLGQRLGDEDVPLTINQMPEHAHGVSPAKETSSTGGGLAHTNMQPSLGLNYIIALQGLFPSRSLADGDDRGTAGGVEPLIGQISLFGGNFAPRGWAFADGQLLAISQHPALFSILGTTYGGDGRTTFGLPDLRGRIPVHPDGSSIRLGSRFGVEDVSLTLAQLPAHNHTIPEPSTAVLASFGLLLVGTRTCLRALLRPLR